MRVAIITDLAPGGMPLGGVQRSTVALVRELIALGVDVRTIAPHHGTGDVHVDSSYDFPLTRVPMRERFQILRGYLPWIQACKPVLAEMNPDIVQGQGLLHNGAAAIAWDGCPRIVAAHGDPLADARAHYPRIANLALLPLLRSTVIGIVRSADVVMNVTGDWRVNCPEEPRRHAIVPNPVEDIFFDGPAPPDGARRVLYFGLARRIKGFDLLLDAWPQVRKQFPDASLEVFGPTEEQAAPFMRGGLDTHLSGVRMHGPVAKERVAKEMRAGGILVVPSRYEVAPVVIGEAWAVGIPVVTTNVGGIPAMVGDAALVCEPSSAALADTLASALADQDPRSLIARGSARAESFRGSTVAGAVIRIYEEMLAIPGR